MSTINSLFWIYLSTVLDVISNSNSLDLNGHGWQPRDHIRSPVSTTKCHEDNHLLMERCVDNSFDSWKYYEKLNTASDRQLTRASCCAMWDARDCQMKIAKNQCSQEGIDQLYAAWDEGIQYWTRVSKCYEYSFYYNSSKCKLNDWSIALIVIACILFTAIIVFLGIRFVKRRNRRNSTKFSQVNQFSFNNK